jgi:hypothetical protein
MTHFTRKSPANKRFVLRPICGDCLERVGIRNRCGGGYAIIDHNARVRVGDIVHCSKIVGQINGMLKQVKEIDGDSVIVGSAYLDESKDFQFEAAEIYGVVIETYDKLWGDREYVRPTHSRKTLEKLVKRSEE